MKKWLREIEREMGEIRNWGNKILLELKILLEGLKNRVYFEEN